jgi:hypothetical protein
MKSFFIIVVALLSTSFLKPEEPNFNVTFKVIDKTTQKPVDNCALYDTKDQYGKTPPDGIKTITKAKGSYTMIFWHASYLQKKSDYDVYALNDNQSNSHTIQLTSKKMIQNLEMQIKQKMNEKGMNTEEEIKPLLKQLKEIYEENGYPEKFKEYQKNTIGPAMKDINNYKSIPTDFEQKPKELQKGPEKKK